MISMDTLGDLDRLLKTTGVDLYLKAESFRSVWVWKATMKREGQVLVHESDADLIIVLRKALRMLADVMYLKPPKETP